jgi:hypothetical protein
MARFRSRPIDADYASGLALQGLAFLAADAGRLSRFLALTGCGPAEIRAQAQSADFQASVLEHLLADESLLLLFATDAGVAPEMIGPAHALLAAAS